MSRVSWLNGHSTVWRGGEFIKALINSVVVKALESFNHDATALVGQGLLIRYHIQLDTPHSVGFVRTSDQYDAGTSTWQHATLTRDRHLYHRRDSNPQSQKASGRRPTP
jgi:hypothetical protein